MKKLLKSPSISVVVPLYNKVDFVARTMASALSQVSPANEIIVIDDGSTDGGADVVETNFPSVSIIRQSNAGEASARNTGLVNANSEWVAFLDADDLWDPDHLLELRYLIAKFPDTHMVATAYEMVPRRRRCFRHGSIFRKRRRANILRLTQKHLGAFWTSALAVKRETLLKEGGFTLHGYGADVDTWIKIGIRYPCAYSSKATATYVTGNPGVMQSQIQVAEEGERNGLIVSSVTDFPGLSYVLTAAAQSESRISNSVAKRYQNGRVCQALKIAIRNDRTRQIAALTSLFQKPIGVRSVMYLAVAKMPPKLRRTIINNWLSIFR